ncbi:MAG: iron ABC transporter permease [Rhodospirillales bacterium]|nr:iron ABC transporter permease [Rhodospirillales bacterium]
MDRPFWARPGPRSFLRVDFWTLGVLIIALLIAIPLFAVLTLALSPSDDIWQHLLDTVLAKYVWTTLSLMLGVGIGTTVIGTATAWLVTMCRFPGRGLFNWALLLPLAVPAYVLAFVVTDQLEYAGTVQTTLRMLFNWESRQDYWFPEIRSLPGAITVMTLVLYPYVYLLARAAFMEQSICVLDVSRTLGNGPWKSFFKVALPLARPAIVIGVTLALMEALNDLGTVEFFAVNTFTSGIYDVWLNMNSRSGAAQLASVLLIFVLTLIALERAARRGQRYHHTSGKYSALPSYRLHGMKALVAFLACAVPLGFGFLLPAGVLLSYSLNFYQETLAANYFQYVANSLTLSSIAAIGSVLIGLFMAYGVRLNGSAIVRMATRFASIGYAVPGAVLAIGIIIPLGAFDNAVDAFLQRTLGISSGLFISGTIVAVIYGYTARFLALSYGTLEASLGKITPSMDGAARTLGQGPGATLRRVHLPLVRGSLLTAGLLVFVDCMKELPLTLILRPFNYDTLSTFVFQYASNEQLEHSALGALTIVAAGIIPVVLLSWGIIQSRPGQDRNGRVEVNK